MPGKDLIPGLVSAAASDLLGAYEVVNASTGATVLGMAISKVIEGRTKAAREILMEEIRHGDRMVSAVGEVDQFAAIIYRYARAAQEGAARLNLRLMAKVIAGQAHLGNLIADEFLYYADILASLRREEIILTATTHRIRREVLGEAVYPFNESRYPEIWNHLLAELVPSLFPNEDMMRATAIAVGRTGLLMSGNTLDGAGYFVTSPLMDRLEQLAPFQGALLAEGFDGPHQTG